jgi:hypothetical protein
MADTRCQVKGCKLKGVTEMLICSKEGCEKKVHMMCYQGIVLRNKQGEELAALPDAKVACTKGCLYQIKLVDCQLVREKS